MTSSSQCSATPIAFERELPPGGMSRLFLATERSLDRRVVIKLLPPEYASEVSAARFQREVTLTANLQHPHILPILSAGSREGLLFYVMPYVEGESLRQRLEREKKLPVSAAVQILREMADALARAHEAGVVHRDIKPENILLQRGHALLADFGVARALHEATGSQRLTETGIGLGTPGYMAPEQLAGDRNIDARANVYALAVVGYEMLAGVAPFTGPTPQAVAAAHFTSAPKPLAQLRSDLPPNLSQAIAQALAKEPDKRFATAADFRDAIAGTAPPGVQRHPVPRSWLVAALAVAVVIGIGSTWAISHRRSPPGPGPATIAVGVFENHTGDKTLDPLGEMAADWVAQGLARTGAVQVVDSRTTVGSGHLNPGSNSAGGAEKGGAVALGQKTGASIVVTGSYYRDGDSLRFQAKLINAATGNVMHPVPSVAGPTASKTAVLEALRNSVTGALAAAVDPRLTAAAVTFVQPPTYEAYAEFMEATDAEMVQGDEREGLRHYLRAATLDTTFYMAFLEAFNDYEGVGDFAHADSIAHVLSRKRDELGPYERAYLDVDLMDIRGDHNGALVAAREWVRRSPTSQEALWELESNAVATNRPREAANVWPRINPDHGLYAGSASAYIDYAEALHALADYAGELRVTTVAHQKYPHDVRVLARLVRALGALGRTAEVLAQLDSLPLLSDASDEQTANEFASMGRELHVHGLSLLSQLAFDRAIALYRAQRSTAAREGIAEDPRTHVTIALNDAGRWAEAYPLAKQMVAVHPDSVDDWGVFGVLAARTGRRDEVVRASAQLKALSQPYAFGRNTMWRGRIASVLGDRDVAVDLVRQALAEGQYYYAVHVIAEFDTLRGYPPFQELIRPKG